MLNSYEGGLCYRESIIFLLHFEMMGKKPQEFLAVGQE